MAANNTRECFTDFIGRKVIGILFEALPLGDAVAKTGASTIVFEDGRGLTIRADGSYGQESAPDIREAIAIRQTELEAAQKEIAGVLTLTQAFDAAIAEMTPPTLVPDPTPATASGSADSGTTVFTVLSDSGATGGAGG